MKPGFRLDVLARTNTRHPDCDSNPVLIHHSQPFTGSAMTIHHITSYYITVLGTCFIISLSTAAVREYAGRCWLSISQS
jgi:hypothetical protein